MQQKLDSKMEALQIINRELETLRQERDHYKTMIDQLKPSRLTTDRLIGDIPVIHLYGILKGRT